MELIDGKKVRDIVLNDLKGRIAKENINLTLAIIYIGHNDGSDVYIKNKIKCADEVGMKTKLYHLEDNVSKDDVLSLIDNLNNDSSIHGVILQSPIPNHLDFDFLSNRIISSKDVDGFTKENVYYNYIKGKGFLPCTVKGILKLFDFYNINLTGKNIVVIGRSKIVGKPLALALLNKDATVTVAHSKTNNLTELCKNADIIISATGHSKLITSEYVKDGAVVVDVGINKVDNRICGDVDFDNVKNKCSFITPVPGGVGPMTVAMLLENVYEAYKEAKNG